MSLQERVKEIIHRWKFTCTIPNEDFDAIINIVREHDKHEHASFALECSEQARADERERCVQVLVKFRDTKEGTISRRVIEQAIDEIEKPRSEENQPEE